MDTAFCRGGQNILSTVVDTKTTVVDLASILPLWTQRPSWRLCQQGPACIRRSSGYTTTVYSIHMHTVVYSLLFTVYRCIRIKNTAVYRYRIQHYTLLANHLNTPEHTARHCVYTSYIGYTLHVYTVYTQCIHSVYTVYTQCIHLLTMLCAHYVHRR